MRTQKLIVMAGLPGSGKSTIAKGLAESLEALLLSVDPIEAAMWESGLSRSETGITAYSVARAMAAENLKLGRTVVIDAVNPVEAARNMWRTLSAECRVPLIFIEALCADEAVHQSRIEARIRNITGMSEVRWDRVVERRQEYEPWTQTRLQLDTSKEAASELIQTALAYLESAHS
ncbi:MAG: AAA family ATPase [Pseudomonadota bacterium]